MTEIRIKTLLALASKLKKADPRLSSQLKVLAEGALGKQHKPKRIRISTSFISALQIIRKKMPRNSYALVGDLAVQCHVPSRSTMDLDFALISLSLPQLKKIFPNGHMGALVYSVPINGVDVDFLLADDFPWNSEAVSKAQISPHIRLPVKVVQPAYLIIYKLEVGRERDITDIKNLLRLPGVYKLTEKLVRKYLPELLEDFEQLFRESQFGL